MSRLPKYEQSFAYHIEVELGLDINKIWNFEKNTVSPYEIFKSGTKNVWLYCLEKDYHNDEGGYEIKCNNFYQGKRCPFCNGKKVHKLDSFAQWGINTFGEDFLEKYWSKKNTINPYLITPQSHKKVWIYCQEKDYHNDEGGYEIVCAKFYNGYRCNYCVNKKVHRLDSLAYLYPQIAEMIIADKRNNITIDNLYKIAPRCTNKYYFKCSECGGSSSNKIKMDNVIGRKFSCEYCSDGISIPEKFMANILRQLKIDFMTQLSKSTFKWCQNYKYDFYISNFGIVETHGMQHYDVSFEGVGGRTLEEEQKNDRLKKELALNNNIDNYIVIDCRYSKFDWLKENIIKELGNHFDLSNIDWKLAWEESQKSLVWETKRLYDLGYNNKQIAEKIGICDTTVTKYKKLLNL